MNDAFIESFIYLPDKEVYKERQKELLEHLKTEVDIINNINIISIFSMGKKGDDDDWNIHMAMKDFN